MKPEFEVFIQPPPKKGGMPFIEIPPEVAEEMLGEKNKVRVVIHFDNGRNFHRALQLSKNGYYFIVLGKTTLKEAKKEPGTYQLVRLEKDNSRYGMHLPEEFEEVLRQDEEGRQRFEELTPGLKRSFLYYVGTGKTMDTRINRSLQLIENLKAGIISAGKPR